MAENTILDRTRFTRTLQIVVQTLEHFDLPAPLAINWFENSRMNESDEPGVVEVQVVTLAGFGRWCAGLSGLYPDAITGQAELDGIRLFDFKMPGADLLQVTWSAARESAAAQ